MAGVEITMVPFKGGGEAQQGILGGQVPFMFSTTIGILPHVRSGQLRALAVSSARRIAVAPELPTVAESGLPGFEANTWHGVVLPAGAQAEVVAKLNREIVAILHLRDVVERLESQGAEPLGSTPEEFAAYIRSETAKWAKVVRESGAKAE